MIKFVCRCSFLLMFTISAVCLAEIVPSGSYIEDSMNLHRSDATRETQVNAVRAPFHFKGVASGISFFMAANGVANVQVKVSPELEKKAVGAENKTKTGKQSKPEMKTRAEKRSKSLKNAKAREEVKVADQERVFENFSEEQLVAEEDALLVAAPVADIESVELDEPKVDEQAQINAARIAEEYKIETELKQLVAQAEKEESEKNARAAQQEQEAILEAEQREQQEILKASEKNASERYDAEKMARDERIKSEQKAREDRIAVEKMAREERLNVEKIARDEWIKFQQNLSEIDRQTVMNYKEKIVTKIRHNTVKLPGIPARMSARFSVTINQDGLIASVKRLKSSGSVAYDFMVERAIQQSQPLPLPPDPILFENFRVLHVKVGADSSNK